MAGVESVRANTGELFEKIAPESVVVWVGQNLWLVIILILVFGFLLMWDYFKGSSGVCGKIYGYLKSKYRARWPRKWRKFGSTPGGAGNGTLGPGGYDDGIDL